MLCCVVVLECVVSDQNNSHLSVAVWSFLYLISSGEHDACVGCVCKAEPKSVLEV